MLETPVTSAPIVAGYLSNLPAYRTGVSPLLRGVEIGLAHGFFLVRRTRPGPAAAPRCVFTCSAAARLPTHPAWRRRSAGPQRSPAASARPRRRSWVACQAAALCAALHARRLHAHTWRLHGSAPPLTRACAAAGPVHQAGPAAQCGGDRGEGWLPGGRGPGRYPGARAHRVRRHAVPAGRADAGRQDAVGPRGCARPAAGAGPARRAYARAFPRGDTQGVALAACLPYGIHAAAVPHVHCGSLVWVVPWAAVQRLQFSPACTLRRLLARAVAARLRRPLWCTFHGSVLACRNTTMRMSRQPSTCGLAGQPGETPC